jgi:hypothetical protein
METLLIHLRKHPEFVDGCFGCKAATIRFGEVPGMNRNVDSTNRRERGLIRYEERKAAGERPSSITLEGQEQDERKYDTEEKARRIGMLEE